MTKLIVQLVCLLVALVLSDGKQWNTTDPVVKFYCEVDHLKNVSVELFKLVSYSYSMGNLYTYYYYYYYVKGNKYNSIRLLYL